VTPATHRYEPGGGAPAVKTAKEQRGCRDALRSASDGAFVSGPPPTATGAPVVASSRALVSSPAGEPLNSRRRPNDSRPTLNRPFDRYRHEFLPNRPPGIDRLRITPAVKLPGGFVSGSGNSRMFHDELPPELSAAVSQSSTSFPRVRRQRCRPADQLNFTDQSLAGKLGARPRGASGGLPALQRAAHGFSRPAARNRRGRPATFSASGAAPTHRQAAPDRGPYWGPTRQAANEPTQIPHRLRLRHGAVGGSCGYGRGRRISLRTGPAHRR